MSGLVRDFMVFLLLRWLFSEEHPLSSAKYAACTFVQLLMNAVQAKDYVVAVSGLDPGLPGSDTLFWRLNECASFDLILQEYKNVVTRKVEAVKRQIRRRRFKIHHFSHPKPENRHGERILHERAGDVRKITHTSRDPPS